MLTQAGCFAKVAMHTKNRKLDMRIKTLLLAGVISAASAISSFGQTVYSANAVGFVNVTCPPGFSMIANPLKAATNTIPALLTTVPVGTRVFKFSNAANQYVSVQFFGTFWNTPANANNMTLLPGEGVFVQNQTATNFVVQFVGEVETGSLTNVIPVGFAMVSSMLPTQGLVQTDMGLTLGSGDRVFVFNNAANQYVSSQFFPPSTWIGGGGQPQVAVGQSFFVKSTAGTNWVRSFSVGQ